MSESRQIDYDAVAASYDRRYQVNRLAGVETASCGFSSLERVREWMLLAGFDRIEVVPVERIERGFERRRRSALPLRGLPALGFLAIHCESADLQESLP